MSSAASSISMLEGALLPLLETSCLLPLFSTYLMGTSLLDVMKNNDLYLTLFAVTESLCRIPSLVPLLCPDEFLKSNGGHGEAGSSSSSIYSMLKSLRNLADSIIKQVLFHFCAF